MKATTKKRTVTFDGFCEETGVRPTTGRRLIREGRLPVIRAGRRVLIARETIERFLRGELPTGPNTTAA